MARFMMWAAPLLLGAAPTFAQPASTDTATAAPAPAAPAAAPAKPKKICRTFKVTGRRIAQTTCYTAAQWADLDKSNEAAAKKLVDDVAATSGRSNLSGSAGGGGLSTGSIFGLGSGQ